ncbi:MAG: lipoate--protein ligase [Treponema sp.]|jgi:lipoate-protein ligase A|nr:lipoate--protein ligase [Treponema sp.]
MMYYIRSVDYDAALNLALEQYVFDRLDRGNSYMMLWQNANAIIVGKHQNTVEEINVSYVKEHDIQVVRRLSGGGAVYHDMGNINFTFITDAGDEKFDFAFFCYPVVRILQSLGMNAGISGRNDMTIDGMKFSGNSQYIKQRRVMHHGTIMFDSDLNVLSKALTVSKDKIESKGLKSTYSRVTNVRPHITRDCGTEQFMDILEEQLIKQFDAQKIPPEAINMDEVYRIRAETYDTWEWNYGYSPDYSIRKKRRFDGVGEIEVRMDVSDGYIRHLVFFGDFFAKKEHDELINILIGVKLNVSFIGEALSHLSADDYFQNLRNEDLMDLLL